MPFKRTLLAVVFAAVAATVLYAHWRRTNSPERLLKKSDEAFQQADYVRALQLADRCLARTPRSSGGLILAGQSAVRLGEYERALDYFSRVRLDNDPKSLEALVAAGELAFELGRARDSEQHLRTVLDHDPRHSLANGLLAYLLVLEGRSWEAFPFLYEPVRQRDAPLEHLLLLGVSEPFVGNEEKQERFRVAVPNDPVPLIGDARSALAVHKINRAEELLRKIISRVPDQVEAQARFGGLLLESSSEVFFEWHDRLPPESDGHPETWMVRGLWAENQGRPRVAIRCYWEATKLDPNHGGANYRLGQRLGSLGEDVRAAPFLLRAARLQELTTVVDDIRRNRHLPPSPDFLDRLRRAAQLTETMGRIGEAWCWSEEALKLDAGLAWAWETNRRLLALVRSDLPRTLDEKNPARQIDLSEFPLLDRRVGSRSAAGTQTGAASPTRVTFQNDARSSGLDFTYFSSTDPDSGQVRLIETTGGGVGVLDFDGDFWPDLYFTQGCDWPPQDGQHKYLDRLYRNLGNGRFLEVSELAGLNDERYSQGVAVGDFDNDGFPDVYLANIGSNRLYRNNGDGTFDDVTGQLETVGHWWTTSCMMADLNGDALPDLYDVNYVSNKDLQRAVCRRGEEVGGCSPGIFDAAQDRLFVNLGDGRFQDVTLSSGIVAPDGLGLGILAADFEGTGRLGLFVSNDAFPNFYFTNVSADGEGEMKFEERAAFAGLALDRRGRAQASMGIAAGDPNGDGLLDLFVTNFYAESNAFYLHQPGHLFDDASGAAGLRNPSLTRLAFGTQFLDAELDGLPDLLLTNGHIFDLSDQGVPFKMPPQYYRNLGGGKFEEVDSRTLGPFFEGKYRGRGLARLDWNRDGREDVAVSHLDHPAALLTNTTPSEGHFFALRLRGTASSRDAVGAIVTLRAGDKTAVQHLTGGDGFHATNQRRFVFGLGESRKVDQLQIRWPQGQTQTFDRLPVDVELLFLEGRRQPVRISP